MLSTHPKIYGYPVGQHPYALNLMKGILNNRPPKPRYSYRRDVLQVTEYIENGQQFFPIVKTTISQAGYLTGDHLS